MIELLWLKKLLGELNIDSHCTPIVFCDIQGTSALAKHHVFYSRTKHVEIKFYFILKGY